MDPIWRELPRNLVDLTCNKLPRVRRIPEGLKRQIEAYKLYRDKHMELKKLYYENPWIGMGFGNHDEYMLECNLLQDIILAWNVLIF
jgi:hypothetical protein